MNKIIVKSILNKMKRRDSWFLCDYSLNPYSGCPFNCLYCYVRGSKYGVNMAKSFSVKVNAPELLEKQLARRASKGEYGIIALSSSTEPYCKPEEKLKLTRRLLEIILKYKFPVEIATKGVLVTRDFDILKKIKDNAILPRDLKVPGVIISFSISTLDENLARVLEPGAPGPRERLECMRACHEAGFFTGVNFIPCLPYISDSDEAVEQIIKTVKEYSGDFIFVGGLTLFGSGPSDCKTLYYEFLEKYYPDLVSKYKSLYRVFFAPSKEYGMRIDDFARKTCKKYKLKYRIIDSGKLFD